MWWRALTGDYLDVELGVAPGIKARIVERPGRWMEQRHVEQLVEDVRDVARKTVPGDTLDYGVLTGAQDRLEASILTVLYDTRSGKPVAFNALALMDVTLHGSTVSVVHLGLVMVDPDVRSKGLSWVLYGLTCLILFARRQLRPLWLSNVTQVPAIVGMVADSFADVFPRPDPAARRSFDHLVLAREIMSRHRGVFGVGDDAGFDEDRFVITNAYTGGSDNLKKTFDDAPKSRDEIYNTFCETELDYASGDDLLQLGRLDIATAQKFILKDIPRRSLPAVASTLAVVSLNRLILPLIYWLSTEHQWGILRPARSDHEGTAR